MLKLDITKDEVILNIDRENYCYFENFADEASVGVSVMLKDYLVSCIRSIPLSIEIVEEKRGK